MVRNREIIVSKVRGESEKSRVEKRALLITMLAKYTKLLLNILIKAKISRQEL